MQFHHAREATRDPPPARCLLHELAHDWSPDLQLKASAYVEGHRLRVPTILRVDVVLMLLRIGTEEALQRASELAGTSITKCPSAVPPWPPKPVAKRPRVPVVDRVAPNTCSAGTDMHRRYDLVKVGMTKEQLYARGVTPRDLRVWKDRVAFTAPKVRPDQSLA